MSLNVNARVGKQQLELKVFSYYKFKQTLIFKIRLQKASQEVQNHYLC